MKFYIAAKFEKKDFVQDIYTKLEKTGHEITYKWITHKDIKPYTENAPQAREYAENEFAGIMASDVFLFFSDAKGTTLFMEYGAALAFQAKAGKPLVYVIGEYNAKSPWFFNSRAKRVNTFEEVMNELNINLA